MAISLPSTSLPITWTLDLSEVGLEDVAQVGGKNASLGELSKALSGEGIATVDGFATTAEAYRSFASEELKVKLRAALALVDPHDVKTLAEGGQRARKAVLATPLPDALVEAIRSSYRRLCDRMGGERPLAVRSSATAEDLPGASFAGQHHTYLNVEGERALIEAVHNCYASLFTDRAIDYRERNGFDHFAVALSVGVQPMVRSDAACAGVIFTLDPDSGFRDAVVISGAYGLGEAVVQGTIQPDEWTLFKPSLRKGLDPILGQRIGSKETKVVFAGEGGVRTVRVRRADRVRPCLTEDEVTQLARWALAIETHYSKRVGHRQPMDIEWAKDGPQGKLYILQARPETVHSVAKTKVQKSYRLARKAAEPLVTGQAVGTQIAVGPVRVVRSPAELATVRPGDVLVADSTDPDWEPVLMRVAAIVTDRGGRTAHAAIVAREIGVPCVVGAANATRTLETGSIVTVSCAEGTQGRVYAGAVPFLADETELSSLAATRTKIMLNVGDPAKAFDASSLPSAGVGLARIEFIVNNAIGIHPTALCRYPRIEPDARLEIAARLGDEDPCDFFVRRLARGIATIAAAFHPRPVIVRTSDFKTNEYAKLLGGTEFEPAEENPMLGFRGASRYADPRYAEAFALECRALKYVRERMGLTNVKVMIPFCRTPEEGERVLEQMARCGLRRGENDLEILCMCEIPSNVIEADRFLKIFDGFSIGSNDLTQLTLGIDRDSHTVAGLFDERESSVKRLISAAIEAAHRASRTCGICGQAPSDYPDFAAWLVRQEIDSISVTPDAFLATVQAVAKAEASVSEVESHPRTSTFATTLQVAG